MTPLHPSQLSIHDFEYDLPADRIARYPLPERDASKLLVHHNNGQITTTVYKNIDQYLPENSLLVFNDTKVVEARLLFQKSTGARIEIFCLEPHPQYADITTAMSQKGNVVWMCLIGGASKWKPGQVLEKRISLSGHEIVLQAKYGGKEKDVFAIELSWEPASFTFAEVLHHTGIIPLPPYIKREAEAADAIRYQTIYAHEEGSVAAPTAGLHFTDHIFRQLDKKNIQRACVTLHVGAGTFKPVKSETMGDHEMHTEFIDVQAGTIECLIRYLDKHITAVGTTSLRTIESLYWLGVKAIRHPHIVPEAMTVQQWEPYNPGNTDIPAKAALEALLHWMQQQGMQRLITKTQLLIAPGYTTRIPKALVTNFHQPQSTLLLLVAAFAGKQWRTIYQYALDNDFRFLSYGDGCLLLRQ